MRQPTIRKAPTASGKPPAVAPVAARRAAPGVDHAEEIGIRDRTLMITPARPMAIARAVNPEAACVSDAPTAISPLSTTANEDANPTNAVRIPAEIG
jgi:hypothetical protein